ncbi:cystatin domain-containing protein [Sphingomonas sp. G-3-2-10]|uniref:cystatin domain-containing protein n=1 Tax=Sphingomonas sp. G-3-2-10 TaxID=2728838 RepID=UPI00146C4EA5|nr:cystatin domain-containing protein [Sphingomonas sp. G-3-2-10]NML05241.1 hypothetical protein [Sphingomonas sp. G-3-2-10]
MRLVLASVAATLMFATAAQAQDAPAPVVGGFSATEATPEVTKAAEFALGELKIPADQLDRVEDVEKQVVAGMNYRFTLVLKDGHKWKVQVWAKLDRSYELTHSEEVHAH